MSRPPAFQQCTCFMRGGGRHACAIALNGVASRDLLPQAEMKKGPEGAFSSHHAVCARICMANSGAGDESCTRALSLCFPITFSTVVISEELNYSLVFRPRQQSSSNHFHQRPRMIHPPVVTPDASSC